MSLKRITDRYSSDKAIAQSSTQIQINFILANMEWLDRVDKKGVHRKFMEGLGPVNSLADWEVSRVERIYELVWKGYEMPSVNVHVDKKRKGLNYGI